MSEFNVNFNLVNSEPINGNFVLSAEEEDLIASFLLDGTETLSGIFTVDNTNPINASFIYGTCPNINAVFKIDYYPMKTSELTNDSGFITSVDVPTTLAELEDDSTHRLVTDTQISNWNGKQDAGDYATNTALSNKVDKITGKGLSTNDLTDTLKINYDTAYTNNHTHANKTILDNTTASFTTEQATNLSNQSGTNTGDETNTTIKNKLGTDLSNKLDYNGNGSSLTGLTKTQVGLSNVDNTSDANKPVSTAQQTALNLKANDSAVVHKTGAETIYGTKTFSESTVFSSPYYPVTTHERKSGVNNSLVAVGRYVASTTGDMVDGFGCHYDYVVKDNSGTYCQLARVGAKRDGGDVTGTIYLTTTNNGTIAEKYNIKPTGHLLPYLDNSYNLGDATHRMGTIYAGTGTINTSDERQKEQIASLSDDGRMSIFFDSLRPVSFKFKDYTEKTKVTKLEEGENGEQIEVGGEQEINHSFKRLHHGLIAQEVEKSMSDSNIDNTEFAGLIKDIESDYYGLRYEEFIPMLIQQVQMLKEEVRILKNGY